VFDIGFWELLLIAGVLLLVMGPERLPEVARQAAFLVRKARQGMFRIRNEMRSELEGTPFQDLEDAKREIFDFKNDMKQFGRDLADSAEQNHSDRAAVSHSDFEPVSETDAALVDEKAEIKGVERDDLKGEKPLNDA